MNNFDNVKKNFELMKYHIQIIFNMIDSIQNTNDIMLEIKIHEEYITQIIDKNLKKIFIYYCKNKNHNLCEYIQSNINDVSIKCVKSGYSMVSPLKSLSAWEKKFIIKSKI